MPMMKSYHGSIGISGFLFRKTWKPKAPWPPLGFCEGESESRREMKRLSAPNISFRSVGAFADGLSRHTLRDVLALR